ncbi:hypothetical protein [Motilibacter aurantiacus]|uniref:hypothetical protein n=1 Tax=Motilibacter aurantiacus TaxID=2714955 RepID=UPI00140D18CC|nr:hypothetical protein [Motilibacter aurantiacus]NHC47144.1 hypothetical protein [Motilibacter aurantiacus]
MKRSLRHRCETRLRQLALPDVVTSMVDVVDHVERLRERPVRLRPLSLPPGGPTGAWVATSELDYVFYERDTSPRHQAQIIAHELGHMTSGHRSSPAAVLAPLLLAPGAATVMLAREAYATDEEREAEQMADLLVAYVEASMERAPALSALEAALKRDSRRL